MKPKKVRRLLAEGLEAHRVTRVWRDAYDSAYTDGLIVKLTNEWVVMHVIDDGVCLDSLLMMRVSDISTVIDGHNDYLARALRGLGQSVAGFACPEEATVRDLVVAAADLHPLTAFALGDEGEEQLMVGRLIKAGKNRVRHRFLRPDGTWADNVDRWRYEQISSIHVGGRYLNALAQFGDPCPGDGPGGEPESGGVATEEPTDAERINSLERHLHIMDALSTAANDARKVLDLILGASGVDEARGRLQDTFGFDDVQASAVLDMQFRRAATLDREQIDAQHRNLLSELAVMTEPGQA